MIKTLIFDVGHVLLRDDYTYYVKEKLANLTQLKRREFEKAQELAVKGKINKEDFQIHFDEAFGDGALNERDNLVKSAIQIESSHNHRIISLLPKFKKSYMLVILSNNMKWWSPLVRECSFMSYFDIAFFSDEIGMMKPDNEVYCYTLNKARVSADEALLIDDSASNIAAAENLGIKTIHYTDWNQAIDL